METEAEGMLLVWIGLSWGINGGWGRVEINEWDTVTQHHQHHQHQHRRVIFRISFAILSMPFLEER